MLLIINLRGALNNIGAVGINLGFLDLFVLLPLLLSLLFHALARRRHCLLRQGFWLALVLVVVDTRRAISFRDVGIIQNLVVEQ